jgi:endogenous inhibitor of DNA gyrase (YacG/DUF329 family)
MRKVPCPRCGSPAAFSPENKWRPFCSERCKMIDLGQWASEGYRIPEVSEPSSEDERPEQQQLNPTPR